MSLLFTLFINISETSSQSFSLLKKFSGHKMKLQRSELMEIGDAAHKGDAEGELSDVA